MRRVLLILIVFCFCTQGMTQILEETYRFGSTGSNAGEFKNPLALDMSTNGILYVVDTGNHRIQLFDRKGNFQKMIGGFGFTEDRFDTPRDIWVRSMMNIYVSDYNNQRLQRYDRNMNFLSTFQRNEAEADRFQFYEVPSAAVNSQNDLFIVDHDENKVIKFNRNNQPERSFGTIESGSGELERPQQIDILPSNRVVISDAGKKALMIYDAFGSFIRAVTDQRFRMPRGICVGNKGRLFVADPEAGAIFVVSADFSGISSLTLRGGSPFAHPQDVTLYDDYTGRYHLYILDGDQVIIGMLVE